MARESKRFFVKAETKAKQRLVQEVFFSYGYKWWSSGQEVVDVKDCIYFFIHDKNKKLIDAGSIYFVGDENTSTVISMEEFLGDTQHYLY